MPPLYKHAWSARSLQAAHPLRTHEPNKSLVLERCAPPDRPWLGTVEISRWPQEHLPQRVPTAALQVDLVPAYFLYEADPGRAWYVNFADPEVFFAWRSSLLAQDELQCMEHPVLGLVREALLEAGLSTRTAERDRATPILVKGVERRCAFDTRPSPSAPGGLYGNRFSRGSREQILAALRLIDPPTTTNLVCMAAPACGSGAYREGELRSTLATATTAFQAAVAETAGPTEIHTGFWGCGAFGGDRVIMVALQALAARLVGLERIVFYTGDADGLQIAREGLEALEGALRPTVEGCLAAILALGRRWGLSDGN